MELKIKVRAGCVTSAALSCCSDLSSGSPSQVMDDDTGFDEKLGGGVIQLDKLNLEHAPVHEHMIKVDSHLISKDAKMYLNFSWHA